MGNWDAWRGIGIDERLNVLTPAVELEPTSVLVRVVASTDTTQPVTCDARFSFINHARMKLHMFRGSSLSMLDIGSGREIRAICYGTGIL